MSPLPIDRYSALQDEWAVDSHDFTAPLVKGQPEQLLIFADRLRNGSVACDVTILESIDREAGYPFNEAALVVRYAPPNTHIYAGIGGFGRKFFIGSALQSPPFWVHHTSIGQAKSVAKDKIYRLRVEFSASRIALFENDVQQLVYIDETNRLGQLGLRTWNTSARFENLRVLKARPKAFLVMPFKSEFDFVHKVIERTAVVFGVDCVRADEMAISRPVMEDVKAQVAEADLIIVDFTGTNPNVYYEAGLADAMKKDWIILAQSTDDLAFDVRHIRCIQYSNLMGADQKLTTDFENALAALGYPRS
jgi:hypothetical protein